MKAVNLIPADARRGRGGTGGSGAAAYAVLGLLAVAVALVTVYVLTTNQISSQQAKVSALQAEAARAQGAAAQLGPYVQFEKLAQARTETVRQIASSGFDWHAALVGLSRVVPANTSLQSLVATIAPGAGTGSSAGGGAGGLRTVIAAPAFQISGCSDSQDDVARLISQLRVIPGVTRVSLQDSQKGGSSSGAAVSTPATSSTPGGSGCRAGGPTFDLVVFFTPPPNSGPTSTGSATPAAATSTATTPTATTATATTPAGGSK